MSEILRVGDTVYHAFSDNKGVLIGWRSDPMGYEYQIKFEDPKRKTNWFKREVIITQPTEEQL